jgi:hypothetical protein
MLYPVIVSYEKKGIMNRTDVFPLAFICNSPSLYSWMPGQISSGGEGRILPEGIFDMVIANGHVNWSGIYVEVNFA